MKLTEKDIQYLVTETIKRVLIKENQESTSQKEAMRLYMQRTGQSKEKAEEFVRVTIRNDIPSLRDKKGGKFVLGCTRMFLDRQITDERTISSLNQTLKLLTSAHYDEYDRNLNGLSAQSLINRFSKAISDNIEKEKSELSKVEYSRNSDYNIIPINSFEEAKEYNKYFEGRTNKGTWCLTHMEDMFDSYTSGGINQTYFCLRNGFESLEPEVGKDCPLDDFGLSMISVIVNENGGLAHSTCRWNHENRGSDSILSIKQISDLIGANFYEVFKPNHKWQDMVDNAMERLRNGEKAIDIFDYIDDFGDGYARVKLNGRWNWIDTKGNLISHRQWFDRISSFCEDGYAIVALNNNYNFINTEGNLVSPNQWFDTIGRFKENGYAYVGLNGKQNFIDIDGNILYGDLYDTSTWFDNVYGFENGYAKVVLNGDEYKLDTKGNLHEIN